ncbi:MAG TPA: rhomboid family intramembrane serine protease [Steroidobacteraceae bacterium]|nr:rhomboid family intramembrane serine protease [Steroidobacteraceae bacterium]HQW08313.1 rhomboid family intramembrane serine protease [Steroidobacteraceae bacterium]HQX79716.1 rhomboid family intramembrane serine protease [Steroidobacteraceae bacterium]HQZ80296.1 rhomboid family intramembrane serine protease [Steroidobacteraceae bacterium]
MDEPGAGTPPAEAPVAVFVADDPRACEERAFVLTAVGIPHLVALAPAGHVLLVDPAHAAEAREHLARYAAERRAPPPPSPVPRPGHPLAWLGSLAYALVLFAIGLAIGAGIGPLDAYPRGVADAQLIRQGEWWRAITALTLHVDAPHLVANLAAGAWFGYLAGRRIGPGWAWLLTLLAAAAANGIEALFGPVPHRSVGASTAVFAALGLLAAHAWRERYPLRARWVVRWAPLVGGVLLLGWLGTEGEHTDVMAHVLGFGCGTLAGLVVARAAVARALARVPQRLAGAAALALLGLAWLRAMG